MCLSQTKGKNHEDWLNNITIKTYWDDTFMLMNNVEKKITSRKMCLSQTKEKNHKDWLYSGFGKFYSKSCYFFDSNHITLKIYWDHTIDCNEQRWNKITSKKGVFVSDQREKP